MSYERIFLLPPDAATDLDVLHQSVWAVMAVDGRHGERDFVYAAIRTATGIAVKVRTERARPGWREAVLPGLVAGTLRVALRSRHDLHATTRQDAFDKLQRQLGAGFDMTSLTVSEPERVATPRGGVWSVVAVDFAGRVRDVATASALFARGIGRGRAFGFGMLLVQPA